MYRCDERSVDLTHGVGDNAVVAFSRASVSFDRHETVRLTYFACGAFYALVQSLCTVGRRKIEFAVRYRRGLGPIVRRCSSTEGLTE